MRLIHSNRRPATGLEALAEVSALKEPLQRMRRVGEDDQVLASILAIGRTYDESYTSPTPIAIDDDDDDRPIKPAKRVKRRRRVLASTPPMPRGETKLLDEGLACPEIERVWKTAQNAPHDDIAARVRDWKKVAGDIKEKLEALVETNGFIFTDDRILQACLDFAASIQVWSYSPAPGSTLREETSRSLCRDFVSQRKDRFAVLRLASAQISPPRSTESPITSAASPTDDPELDPHVDSEDDVDPLDRTRCYLCGLPPHDDTFLECGNSTCGKGFLISL
ncbi:hypothetical protein ACHHYP_08036 [Achlya hypogyna]|uniref:Uncharacterized protein n=1 Tax=Achlya hypogyna TaxID=1202772 RepID=A0A1V9YPY4_ACHHY|nr:hypothetical protein ACHHYP_08036 [Achlya hypogyna]